MDSTAIGTRALRVPVALAIGGAVLFMGGVTMTLAGQLLQLSQPAGWRQLTVPGLALIVIGLAFGAASVVMAFTGLARRGRAGGRHGGEAAGDSAADPARDWLESLRGAASDPAHAGDGIPGYADEGWRLDTLGLGPPPVAAPPEIHHPVRPMTVRRSAGQHAGPESS